MKCLLRYNWVKLPRNCLPKGKGVMGSWAKLASRAAFRAGKARYCGHINSVQAGAWAGGVVGLKAILGIKSMDKALGALHTLSELGYIGYRLDNQTKKLVYSVMDLVSLCTGQDCSTTSVYATNDYGFLCVPRSLTDRLVAQQHTFEDADAFLDLWCHTVWNEDRNVLSKVAPTVQFGKDKIALTLEFLGKRWNWEKTKVWRFFHKHGDAFTLHKLPSSCGCLIINRNYPGFTYEEGPVYAEIKRFLDEIRFWEEKTFFAESENQRLNRMILHYSINNMDAQPRQAAFFIAQDRVALSPLYKRAYFSDCWNCLYALSCIETGVFQKTSNTPIRGPCPKSRPSFLT